MAIIGNPWTQDAAAFGQQTGNALAQGLMRLPQERYQLALNAANQARQMQAMQNLQQYHQGMLGIRQQGLNNQQQGLDMRNQNEQMANQIRMLMAQVAAGNLQNRQNAPLVVPAGSSVFDRNSLVGGQQPSSPDYGPMGNTPPQQQGLQQPQAQPVVSPLATAPVRQPAVNPNAEMRNQLDAGRLYGQALSSTNLPNQDPKVVGTLSNLFYNAKPPMPQSGGAGTGQPTTNALQQAPANPQTGGRPISLEVAQLFLQKANGDKDLARQMARQAGFAF